jgi:SP family general alpha glucoside:H+ symporter-like MFS transporter
MLPALLVVGILACLKQTHAMRWAQGSVLPIWFFGYGWSLGPLAFVIASETRSAQLRQKTTAIARGSQSVFAIVNTVAAPVSHQPPVASHELEVDTQYVLNPTASNLKGKAAFIPTGLIVLLIVRSYFGLPETRGKTFEELNVLFAKKVPVRKFKEYHLTAEDVVPELDKN